MKTLKKKVEETSARGVGKKIKMGPNGEIASSSLSTPTASSKSPNSFEIFQRTIKRANNLINHHKDGKQCGEADYDSFRAAIVLSISALDAFIRTLVVDKILNKLSDKNASISKELTDYIKNLMNQDLLLEAARKYEFREKVEKTIRADFETKSFQGEYRINYYLELAGYKDIFEDVSHSANKSKARLRSDLERYTKRRHIIAHCGDYELNQIPHCENDISKDYAKDCIEIVSLFAEHIFKITNK